MLLRMLNDPCQSETGRQMARANPQYRRCYAESQEPGAALARAVKSSTALAEIILFDSRATRGNVAAFRSSPDPRAARRCAGHPVIWTPARNDFLDAIRPDRPGPSTLPAPLGVSLNRAVSTD